MLTLEQAKDWIIEQWEHNSFCSIQFAYPGIKSLHIKGAFELEDALTLTDHVLEVDGAVIVDVIVNTPDENTSWFTWLNSKDIDGNRQKYCHRCRNRFIEEMCPKHDW